MTEIKWLTHSPILHQVPLWDVSRVYAIDAIVMHELCKGSIRIAHWWQSLADANCGHKPKHGSDQWKQAGTKLTHSEKGLLMQLADDHNEDVAGMFSSIPDMARRIPLSVKQTRRLIHHLEELAIIESMQRVREENGGGTSNLYRFWFDPPFNPRERAKHEKMLKLQQARLLARPQQTNLQLRTVAEENPEALFLAPPTDGRGPLPPRGGPPSHARESLPPMDGSPPLPPVGGAIEPPLEPPGKPVFETPGEPKKLPALSAGLTTDDLDRWNRFVLELKSDLHTGVPDNVAAAKGWTPVQPSEGFLPTWMNDYEVGFRDWWLRGVVRLPRTVIFVTAAADLIATEACRAKYHRRLDRLARKHFPDIGKRNVTFQFHAAARPY